MFFIYFRYFSVTDRLCPTHFSRLSNKLKRVASVCFILFSVLSTPLTAQVNIFTGETLRQMQLKAGWYNSITLDLTYRDGNTELLTTRTRFRSDYLSRTYHSFIFGSLQHARKDGQFFINKGMAHARIIRRLTQHFLVESFVQKQFNESILLSDRNLAGGGLRFALLPPTSGVNIYLGIGTMWEHEQINDTQNGEITTSIFRSTNYINWSGQLDERVTTGATVYYQIHLQRFQDYRILFEGNLTFRLTAKLAFPVRVNFRYDNEPPSPLRKYDVEIFNGFRYTF